MKNIRIHQIQKTLTFLFMTISLLVGFQNCDGSGGGGGGMLLAFLLELILPAPP